MTAVTTVTTAQRDVTLITTERQKVTLGDLLGKPLVLAFFPAAFTGVCTTEMCALRDSMACFNAARVQVYGISIDTPFTLAVFAQQNGLTFPLLSDANREATRAFDVVWPDLAGVREISRRAVFVLDGDGTIVYRWVGEVLSQEPPYAEVLAAAERLKP